MLYIIKFKQDINMPCTIYNININKYYEQITKTPNFENTVPMPYFPDEQFREVRPPNRDSQFQKECDQ